MKRRGMLQCSQRLKFYCPLWQYYFNGSQILAEETNGNITLYLYDSTGIIGFQYHGSSYAANTWDTYFYEKNLHGDIIAVYTSDGVKKLSYTYDAWGSFTTSYYNGASASTLWDIESC